VQRWILRELRPFRMTAGLGGFDRAGEVCVLDSLAPGRGLNRFSDCTQDFRPGLLSVAPAGAALGWTGVFSAETSFFVATLERGRSCLHLATSSRRVIRLESGG